LVPGTPVGAGGAFTPGLKELPPVGFRLFSVGETDGAVVDVVVVVSVVLEGPDAPPPQAVSAPMDTKAAMPRPAATRRVSRRCMKQSYLCRLTNQLWVPGMAVGAGGAVTGGVNRLPPVGLMLFSVGETDGAVVVVVVSVVLEGPDAPPPQAVNAPMEMKAATPSPAATRRVSRLFMLQSYLCCWETLRMIAN
jgi:hypothetical protein